jgi:hypothetical protein
MKAFPNPHAFNAESAQLGMDLRDYFAAKAMQGILASFVGVDLPDENIATGAAYEYADAMMKAREK